MLTDNYIYKYNYDSANYQQIYITDYLLLIICMCVCVCVCMCVCVTYCTVC